MEYIVSARKYRPLTFDSVVGQSSLTTTLKNAVKSGKLAHAFLFCGPRGVGKTTCARIFAKTINCEHPTPDGEACNECESCKAFNEQRSLNIFELDAASNNSVENIKVLMDQTRVPPQLGRYKVFIIDEVHMLSSQAFNAFLKTLEEPPSYVIFILATTEKHKILPTIISRCQIYDFDRMDVPNIVNHLKMVAGKEGITFEEEALALIAEKADGGMRDALSIFDQSVVYCRGNLTYDKVMENLNVLASEHFFKIVDLSLANKVPEVMVLLNDIINKGFDGGQLVNGLAHHLRNVMMAKDNATLPLLEVSDRLREKFKEQAARCPAKFLYQALRYCNQCDINYRGSSNKRLLVELTLIEAGTGDAAPHPEQSTQTVAVAASPTPSPSISKKKIGDFSVSFKTLKNVGHTTSASEEAEVTNKEEQTQFSQSDLMREWLAMCNRMPQSMAGLAARLKHVTPQITDYPNIELVINNQDLLDQLVQIKGRIRKTMALALHNGNIDFTPRLAKVEEVKPVLSKRELFDKLRQENHALEQLRAALDLELA